ncbi:hypothetical protein [Flavobacterium humi]|uniref:Uncharacterized protein n=1 Tax=Flavobacterium humi TaxID=2562683 RepID=A0A4Z0LB12_9FLAO|nr:hypothetical protein [Flavobacterium humi]TGD58828.1 hypothetical protein E4635_02970 [Flavobacterium humi]
MKNLALNLAIALVIIAYVGGASFGSKEGKKASGDTPDTVQSVLKSKNNETLSSDFKMPDSSTAPKNLLYTTGIPSIRIERVVPLKNKKSKIYFSEVAENDLPARIQTTIEEIIAQDNAVTGNNLSEETPAVNVSIDAVAFNPSGKTIEEIIAQDNAVTENNLSEETQAVNVSIDAVAFNPSGKTIEEIIAQDNAVTENHFSEEISDLRLK